MTATDLTRMCASSVALWGVIILCAFADRLGDDSASLSDSHKNPTASVVALDYAVRYRSEPLPHWRISMEAQGLSRRDARLRVSDWGGWTSVASRDRPYVRIVASEPPVRRDTARPTDFEVLSPDDWDGHLRLEYAIASSPPDDGSRLLPTHGANHAIGYAPGNSNRSKR